MRIHPKAPLAILVAALIPATGSAEEDFLLLDDELPLADLIPSRTDDKVEEEEPSEEELHEIITLLLLPLDKRPRVHDDPSEQHERLLAMLVPYGDIVPETEPVAGETPAIPRPPFGRPLRGELDPGSPGLLLGLRGLAGGSGMGGGTVGGGLDLLIDYGLIEGRLLFGVSADVFGHRLLVRHQDSYGGTQETAFDVRVIPVIAVASYILPGTTGRVSWQATAGAGALLASAGDGTRSGQSWLPAGAFGFGPTIAVGSGAFSISGRVSGGFGSITSRDGTTLVKSMFGGMGLTAGYVLSI